MENFEKKTKILTKNENFDKNEILTKMENFDKNGKS